MKHHKRNNWFLDDEAEDSDDSGTASEDWEANTSDDEFINDDEDFEVGSPHVTLIITSNDTQKKCKKNRPRGFIIPFTS